MSKIFNKMEKNKKKHKVVIIKLWLLTHNRETQVLIKQESVWIQNHTF